MSQSRPEEAKDLVGKAWGIWKKTIGNDDGDEKEGKSIFLKGCLLMNLRNSIFFLFFNSF